MTCAMESSSLLCLEDEMTSTNWDGTVVVDDDDDDGAGSGRSSCRRAFHCRSLLTDDRVLSNLLATERHRRPSADCFCRQTQVLPYMRDTVVTWMLEVLEEQNCDEDVFCMSVNYLDRVLSVLPLSKTQLQLVGCVCMFLASKFTDTVALAAERLVMYTDYSITIDQLLEWELLVVQLLDWDLSAVTPVDFIEQMLSRLSDIISDSGQRAAIRRHATTFVAMCTTDVSFVTCLPSVMAASSISAAASGLLGHVWCRQVNLLPRLHQLTNGDITSLSSCQDRIEQLLNNNVRDTSGLSSPSAPLTPPHTATTPMSKDACLPAQPSTPTDVRDVRV